MSSLYLFINSSTAWHQFDMFAFLNLSMDCVVLLVFCLAAKEDTVEERNFCDGVMDGQDWARDLGFRSEGRKGLGERGIVVDGWEVDSSFFSVLWWWCWGDWVVQGRWLRVLLSLVICVVSAMVSLRESEWSLKRTSLSKRWRRIISCTSFGWPSSIDWKTPLQIGGVID